MSDSSQQCPTSISKALLTKAAEIRLLIMDVDGVLSDGRLFFSNQGEELKSFSSRDGLGLVAIQKYGIELAIITGRRSELLEQRATHLGIKHLFQGQGNKIIAYQRLLDNLQLTNQQACYIGDDWNDLAILSQVGLSATVADGEPEVRKRVDWISSRNGGCGAVRELCHLIMQAQGSEQRWLDQCLSLNPTEPDQSLS